MKIFANNTKDKVGLLLLNSLKNIFQDVPSLLLTKGKKLSEE